MLAPGIPYDWSIVTVYFNTNDNHLASESNKHVVQAKPSLTAPFHVLTFDNLRLETVFQDVGEEPGGLRYLKRCLQDSPRFSLVRYFTTRSLFRPSALTDHLEEAIPGPDQDPGSKYNSEVQAHGRTMWRRQTASYLIITSGCNFTITAFFSHKRYILVVIMRVFLHEERELQNSSSQAN